ncbi:hypothetical protein HDC92_002490 [Pedobacter sp. AK017]|uniref:hypothetical protein n=1 Tax=Pedobacter sp. AK017 TaxID=2723073 RepID=UPI00160A5B98|nr:hypothetical protein [Pedobacter sp. AK017]MBB5438809.1 hypothetical protein [Pedobacter sp. AK017]
MKASILILIVIFLISSCKKDSSYQRKDIATLNVVNMVTDISGVKFNASGSKQSWASIAAVNILTNKIYSVTTNAPSLNIVSAADTTKQLFNKSYNLQSAVYTLYLTGISSNTDTLFRQETNFPFVSTDPAVKLDSVVNLRFVNLSQNSPALKVNIKSGSSNEVDNLAYKSIGAWKPYPAKLTTTAYIFEVRDMLTNAILLTYTFNATSTNRYKNVALVIKGMIGGTGSSAFGIVPVNYF